MNLRHPVPKTGTLPTALHPVNVKLIISKWNFGCNGFPSIPVAAVSVSLCSALARCAKLITVAKAVFSGKETL